MKAKSKKLDEDINSILGNTTQSLNEREEVISNAVDSMMNYGEDQSDFLKYKTIIHDLETKVKLKENEIETKYLSFQKDQQEYRELKNKIRLLKVDSKFRDNQCKNDTQMINNKANVMELNSKEQVNVSDVINSWIIM